MIRILIATSNPHKVQEIRDIIHDPELELFGMEAWPDVQMPEENGTTFMENARLKACEVARQTQEITLADDSGICVDALGGAPGIHSNRFIGEDSTPEERNEALLRLLRKSRSDDERGARFVCAACICFPDGETLEALEVCSGIIAPRPSGGGGFGYDPIFYVPELGCTLAEVPAETKNEISHRGKAMRAVMARLKQRLADVPG